MKLLARVMLLMAIAIATVFAAAPTLPAWARNAGTAAPLDATVGNYYAILDVPDGAANIEVKFWYVEASLTGANPFPVGAPEGLEAPYYEMNRPGAFHGAAAYAEPYAVRFAKNYWIAQDEVSMRLWNAMIGAKPASWPAGTAADMIAAGWSPYPWNAASDDPVIFVAYDHPTNSDVQDFLAGLAALPAFSASPELPRIPTEAEWEFAARAVTPPAAGSPWPRFESTLACARPGRAALVESSATPGNWTDSVVGQREKWDGSQWIKWGATEARLHRDARWWNGSSINSSDYFSPGSLAASETYVRPMPPWGYTYSIAHWVRHGYADVAFLGDTGTSAGATNARLYGPSMIAESGDRTKLYANLYQYRHVIEYRGRYIFDWRHGFHESDATRRFARRPGDDRAQPDMHITVLEAKPHDTSGDGSLSATDRVGVTALIEEVQLIDPYNRWGVRHMPGNVAEWVMDRWNGTAPYNSLAASSAEPSPYRPTIHGNTASPADGHQHNSNPNHPFRVVRGGSWNSSGADCQAHRRGRALPSEENDQIGFRILIREP